MSSVGSLARLVGAVRAAEPRLGAVRLVTVDGPAGSGKTTLADRLGPALGECPVIHMDDLYEGWSGLGPQVWQRLREWVLDPLAAGRPGRYRRYDWQAGRFAEEHEVSPSYALVVEGVGAGAREVDGRASLRIWVEAPPELRLSRGIERGGEAIREEWLRWAEREDAHFRRDRTRERADVVLDGQARLPD